MPLLVMTGVIMAVGVFLPEGPLAHYFKMEALPPLYFVVLPLIVFGYMATTQLMKKVYARWPQGSRVPAVVKAVPDTSSAAQ
jgi:Mg2+-importing ATPase